LSTATRSSGSNIRGIPASGSLLARVELVRATEEDLRWQVPAQFAAEGALDGDRLEGELLTARGYVAAASLAGDDEKSPLDGWESECHCHSVGEIKAKVIHRPVRSRGR